MKILKILEANKALADLNNKDINVKLGYWASKLKRKLETEIKDYRESIFKLQKKYCELDKKGMPKTDEKGAVIFKDGVLEKFSEERDSLLEEDIKINTFPKIKLSYLLLEDSLQGNIIHALGELIKEDVKE